MCHVGRLASEYTAARFGHPAQARPKGAKTWALSWFGTDCFESDGSGGNRGCQISEGVRAWYCPFFGTVCFARPGHLSPPPFPAPSPLNTPPSLPPLLRPTFPLVPSHPHPPHTYFPFPVSGLEVAHLLTSLARSGPTVVISGGFSQRSGTILTPGPAEPEAAKT